MEIVLCQMAGVVVRISHCQLGVLTVGHRLVGHCQLLLTLMSGTPFKNIGFATTKLIIFNKIKIHYK
jgi:hypothetical protein